MASLGNHIRQWKHNRTFLTMIPLDYRDWIITIAFYSALHAIDALLAFDKVRGITSHQARNDVLMRTNRYQRIYKAYHPLYSLSRTIRYLADPQAWISAEDTQPRVIDAYLVPIEQSVERLIGQDLQLGKLRITAASPKC